MKAKQTVLSGAAFKKERSDMYGRLRLCSSSFKILHPGRRIHPRLHSSFKNTFFNEVSFYYALVVIL